MFTRSTLTVEGTDVFYRYNLMMGGNDANDPWGMREEPDEIQGLGNMEIRQQQQHIIRGTFI